MGSVRSWTLGQHSLLISGAAGWPLRKSDLGPLSECEVCDG
jgi:hypothetical protein